MVTIIASADVCFIWIVISLQLFLEAYETGPIDIAENEVCTFGG
jgi:hypothetical protein